ARIGVVFCLGSATQKFCHHKTTEHTRLHTKCPPTHFTRDSILRGRILLFLLLQHLIQNVPNRVLLLLIGVIVRLVLLRRILLLLLLLLVLLILLVLLLISGNRAYDSSNAIVVIVAWLIFAHDRSQDAARQCSGI